MRLQDKVAIITGAANGMGAKEAELFAAEGAKVVATDINEEVLKELVSSIQENGGDIIGIKHDVASEDQWKAVIKQTLDTFGGVDVLVNNAGISINKSFAELSMEQWNQVMDVNLNGCILGMKYAIPEMKNRGSGSVINISSIGGLVGMAGSSHIQLQKAHCVPYLNQQRLSMGKTTFV